jgi:hypothetical protein
MEEALPEIDWAGHSASQILFRSSLIRVGSDPYHWQSNMVNHANPTSEQHTQSMVDTGCQKMFGGWLLSKAGTDGAKFDWRKSFMEKAIQRSKVTGFDQES